MGRLSDHYAFSGETFLPSRDGKRLSGQLERVRNAMSDGRWRTLAQLSILSGGTEASVSARLRDLRKPEFGSHVVERRHVENGLFQYRMVK